MFGSKKNKEFNEFEGALDELRKGSLNAFKLLYDKYQAKIYRFCLRMLGDPDLAKDAFQETFIKVYENRHTFRGDNFSGWLYTIARRTSLNIIRARKEHDSFDEFLYTAEKDTHSDIIMKDAIENAIALLPVSYREAIVLREYEECSYQQIAEILDIDISLAKVRVHRGRLILRKLLQPIKQEIYES